jgi:hypothetical protein
MSRELYALRAMRLREIVVFGGTGYTGANIVGEAAPRSRRESL